MSARSSFFGRPRLLLDCCPSWESVSTTDGVSDVFFLPGQRNESKHLTIFFPPTSVVPIIDHQSLLQPVTDERKKFSAD